MQIIHCENKDIKCYFFSKQHMSFLPVMMEPLYTGWMRKSTSFFEEDRNHKHDGNGKQNRPAQ